MSGDARFEDATERGLRLRAEDAGDLGVIAALLQDAVLAPADMKWDRRRRRFACLVNRFRWEDKAGAEARARDYERVRAVLAIDDATRVRRIGIDPHAPGTVLSLLTLAFEAGEDGGGRILLTFSGRGAVSAEVESVNVTLQDVTRPYRAPSGRAPSHPEA